MVKGRRCDSSTSQRGPIMVSPCTPPPSSHSERKSAATTTRPWARASYTAGIRLDLCSPLFSFYILSSTFYLLSSLFDLLPFLFYILSVIFFLLSSIFYLLPSTFPLLSFTFTLQSSLFLACCSIIAGWYSTYAVAEEEEKDKLMYTTLTIKYYSIIILLSVTLIQYLYSDRERKRNKRLVMSGICIQPW